MRDPRQTTPPNDPAGRRNDPDAVGLPDHIELPDANAYRRDQLWGWVISNAIGLVLVLLFWGITSTHPRLLVFLASLLGLSLVLNIIRWVSAAAAVRKKR